MSADIPDEISIHKLIQSHVVEINSLKRLCKTKQCKQNLQRIPRHMRRRAASHNIKRLPKSLQSFSKPDKKDKKRKKRKSRKIGIRNKNPRRTLLHIWFAKRFKLISKWNKLIPYKNNCKNQRILYRCGKNGYTVFYLSFLKSFMLNCTDSSKDTIFNVLSNFCSAADLDSLRELKDGQNCTIHLYDYRKCPRNLIGPINCVAVEEKKCYWIIVHITIYDFLNDLVLPYFIEKLINIERDLSFSHIRFYGSNSIKHINRIFFQKTNTEIDIPWNKYQCFHVNSKQKTEKHSPVTLLSFIEQIKILENVTDDIHNQSTIVAFFKYHIGRSDTIDLIVENKHLKSIWNRLTENMSQLVGGLRDLEVMALENQFPFFPLIGYFDSKNSENLKFSLDNKFVLRNDKIIESLSNFSIEELKQLEDKDNATVYVVLEYLKGTPKKNDLIYLPDQNEFTSFLNCGKLTKIQKEPKIDSPVGVVEYGSFCMNAAKCRAIGVISLIALEHMIKIQHKLASSQKLYALAKSPQNYFSLVTVSVLKFKNSCF